MKLKNNKDSKKRTIDNFNEINKNYPLKKYIKKLKVKCLFGEDSKDYESHISNI